MLPPDKLLEFVMVPTKSTTPFSRILIELDEVSKTRLNVSPLSPSIVEPGVTPMPVVLKFVPLATTVPVQVPDPHEKSILSALAGDEAKAKTATIRRTESTRVRFIKILPLFGYTRTPTISNNVKHVGFHASIKGKVLILCDLSILGNTLRTLLRQISAHFLQANDTTRRK
jgi:hypothetical protein